MFWSAHWRRTGFAPNFDCEEFVAADLIIEEKEKNATRPIEQARSVVCRKVAAGNRG